MTPENEIPAIAPTPKQIDALILEHAAAQAELQSGGAIKQLAGECAADIQVRLKAWQATAKEIRTAATIVADEVEGRLVAMVKTYGLKHAEKSIRLNGEHDRATGTWGTRVEVKPDGVEAFKGCLVKSKIPGLVGMFFIEHITYSMVAGPDEVLKTLKLGDRMLARFKKFLGGCFEIKTNAPSLKIDTVAATKPVTSVKAA